MGWVSDAIDSVSDFFGGGGSGWGGNTSNASSSYTSNNEISGQRPVGRGDKQTPISSRNDGELVSGPGSVKGTQQGVDTNFMGVPQYEYSEVGALAGGDDENNDGYSDFYTENPSSTIAPTQAKIQQLGSRVVGKLLSPAFGLAGNTITKLQVNGFLPGLSGGTPGEGGDTSGSGDGVDASNTELDGRINEILDDENLSDDDKAQAINETLSQVAKTADIDGMRDLANEAYQSEVGPDGAMKDPSLILQNNRVMDLMEAIDPNAIGTNMDRNDPAYDINDISVSPVTGTAETVGNVDPKQAAWYEAETAYDDVNAALGDAAQGEVRDEALVDPDAVGADMQGAATGTNEDGTKNYLGEALQQSANQNISRVIDTTTTAGRMLAAELGEGNYTDAKATVKGQLDILSKEFVGPNGEPKIPAWAAGTARNVAKIAAFSGMTGSAATAAMATALMEASLPVAQADAQFFQTVTLENLSNRQQSTINRANVLANLNLADMDARMNAAVTNAQTFMQMDLANLDNEQQMRVVNTQARVQTLLEDARSVNAARLFAAESQNDFTKFYDNLNSNIDMFVAEQKNAMTRFNVGEVNDAQEFNASMKRQRDMFEAEMSYNIDLANARWRQTVETTNTEMKFRAAETDVQNLVNISTESMNRLWDREDSLLAYTWKSSETAMDRQIEQYKADRGYDLDERRLDNEEDAAEGAAWYETIKIGADLIGDISGWW